jgi:chemosensory pili system protein ChpA (sensor histidine kinase/response regulator)
VAQQVRRSGREPSAELAMEVATAVLFLEASLAEFQPQDAAFSARLQELAERLDAAAEGRPVAAGALDGGAVPARQRPPDHGQRGGRAARHPGRGRAAAGSVFPQPADRGLLDAVPDQLAQMRGVLSVLGWTRRHWPSRACATVEALRDAAAPDAAVSEGVFEKLAAAWGRWAF